jgi:hypothetical protein
MFKISDWFKLILCTVLSSGVATAGNFGQMNFAYWQKISTGPSATYLVVAGGGGGGGAGGGAGAGGLLTGTSSLTLGTTYTVTVGTGGSGGSGSSPQLNGSNGNNSIISGTGLTTITAIGGGGGGGPSDTSVPSGGSGGGASANGSVTTGGAGTSGQGYAGGSNGGYTSTPYPGGGGGGAGAVGANGSSSGGGNGGVGVSNSITGTATYYAGGGGGSSYTAGGGTGGSGGGGNGSGGGTGSAGTNGLGGGGGGSAYPNNGAAGGSGVVIISLPSGYAANTTGTVTVTTNGTNTVYTFTGSGTLIPRTGTPNYSNYFNGSSYFTPGNTVTNFLCTSTSTGATATFEAWVYPTAYSTGSNAWNFSSISAKDGTYYNFGVYNGYLRFYWYDGSYKYVQSANSTDVPLNAWTYVTMTINGSTIKLYINGVLNTTSATYTGINSGGSGTSDKIGREDSGPSYFTGYISNYRLTNTVVYSSNFTPPTTQLTNITGTQLLTCQNSTLVDNSSNAYSITNSGVTTSGFSPF